jgi:sn-glycerol 3-phosphate transport system permease protein
MTAAPIYAPHGWPRALESIAAWVLGLLWVLPLLYAFWTAFHPPEFATRLSLTAPWTLENFVNAWHAAPFARYFLNTVMLVTMVLGAQLVPVTLAAYAFARFDFPGRGILFALVLVQLMIMPDVLIVENYRTMTTLGLKDTILAIGLTYNFLWPLIITNSVESRPVTVGLQVFSATDQGIDWSIITAATLLSTGSLLIAFLLFQRQFVQSFMRAGIR